MEIIFLFVFFYPLFMSIFWMMGATVYFVRRERNERERPVLPSYPRVAILVPCHNEEVCIRDTLSELSKNNYPDYEIIAIDDGSTDQTINILHDIAQQNKNLRVVSLTHNYGKAMALRAGSLVSSAEFLMCIDADAILDRDALFWMMRHFISGPRVGGVTGNPRVINRNSLLARIQIGEFSAIVGMVKRTQRNLGRIFTVSGVNTCFRRAAIESVGYWSPDTVTEDIDISWRLQLNYWDIRYEPQALTWILVPDTLPALWRQRLRWARGGVEVVRKYASNMRYWVSRRMWPVTVEYWAGVLWCYAFAFTVLAWIGTMLVPSETWPESLVVASLVPGWAGVILAVTCLIQFCVGLLMDSHYEKKGLLKYIFWAIWYPAIYWVLSALTTVVAVPIGLYNRGKTQHAVWSSPKRKVSEITSWIKQPAGNQKASVPSNPGTSPGFWRNSLELLLTLIFWGSWVYLVIPLVSLLLWFVGIYLVIDRMAAMGGYQALADQLGYYSAVVAFMAGAMGGWITWNLLHYGRNDRRGSKPGYVPSDEIHATLGLETDLVKQLRVSRDIALYFDQDNKPVIDHY